MKDKSSGTMTISSSDLDLLALKQEMKNLITFSAVVQEENGHYICDLDPTFNAALLRISKEDASIVEIESLYTLKTGKHATMSKVIVKRDANVQVIEPSKVSEFLISTLNKSRVELANAPKISAKSRILTGITTTYQITVFTGNVGSAGTDANIYMQLFGENGPSPEWNLPEGFPIRGKFEEGKPDLFEFTTDDLGQLSRLHIRHDDKYAKSGWYLDKIEVFNKRTGETSVFPCYAWLAKDEPPYTIERDLYPAKHETH